MSRSNWRSNITVVGGIVTGLLCALWFSTVVALGPAPGKVHATDTSDNAARQQDDAKALGARTANKKEQETSAERKPDCSKSQAPEDCLVQLWTARATQQQADAAWWGGIISILTLAATAVAAGAAIAAVAYSAKSAKYAGDAASASVRSADVAEHALRALERPYLFVQKIDMTFLARSFDSGTRPFIAYTIANYGKTPAIFQSLNIRLENAPTLPLRLPVQNARRFYAIVEPGHRLPRSDNADNSANLAVEGSRPGQAFAGIEATSLILHGSIHYEGPDGALHTDRFCMRAGPDATYWGLEGGEEYNYRKTTYPGGKEPAASNDE